MKNVSLSYNERRFIELIFRQKSISRSEISEQLELTGSSATRIAARLMEIGLIEDEVERLGAMGQPRRPIAIAPGKVFSAGINFALNTIDVAIIDLSGKVVSVRREGLKRSSPEAAAECANQLLERMLGEARISKDDVIGAGISVPANFSDHHGTVLPNALFSEYDNVDLDAVFGKIMGLEMTIENDGACAALGEYYFAEGHRHEIFFLYHLGHGFNGGVMLNGRLYRGAHGNSCVTGVLFPYGEPRPTGTDLVNELAKHGMVLDDVADLANVPADAEPVVSAWIERAAGQLEQAVRIATGFFDPNVIVIGGRLPSDLMQRLTARIAWKTLPGPSRGLKVAPVMASKLGADGGAVGAACVPFFARYFPGSIENGHNNYSNGRRSSAGE
ncbi:ROK family transcriptional regulator [Neorhizobium alkalisoli]|uniref:MarR family transcriptional regulator n=1 Tax=Neorhizobium alkalisoli TaxID=528178 RepID=A0A561R9Q6_9HYPH|nr:ROK family transcriptional regulator [Neorhizobium alkalisoli]TWF59314.1 MarR family transcriptional regulator [Neorhizobium alkalisoli]